MTDAMKTELIVAENFELVNIEEIKMADVERVAHARRQEDKREKRNLRTWQQQNEIEERICARGSDTFKRNERLCR